MPVRKIPVNHRVVTGRQSMQRLRQSVDFESMLERDFLTLCDFDRDVASVEGQPVRINWLDTAGSAHHYTPDFLVKFLPSREHLPPFQPGKARPWLVEVKDSKTLGTHWREFRPRFKAAIAYAKARGWTFHLLTENRIRTPRLQNAQQLLPAMALSYDKGRCDALLRTLEDCGELTATELVAAVCRDPINQAMLLPMLWSLVGWRNIGADLSRPLHMGASLWLPDYMPRTAQRSNQ